MRQIFIFILCASLFTGCKKDSKATEAETQIGADGPEKTKKQSDGLTLLRGEFIYYADAAVLQVGNSIYGVVIDEKMHELNTMGKPYRVESTDGVIVEVRGKIIPKAEDVEGWPFNVEIKEILNVKKLNPKQNEVVKIGK